MESVSSEGSGNEVSEHVESEIDQKAINEVSIN